MANIYQLSTDIQKLYDDIMDSIDEETGEVDIELTNALAVKEEEFKDKAIDTATVARMLKAKKAEVKAEIDRLTAIYKKIDNSIERVESALSTACLRLGVTKIDGVKSSISFKSSEQTMIDDIESIPEEFKKVKVEYVADKTKIKSAIKNGETVNGAHIEEKLNIQIK